MHRTIIRTLIQPVPLAVFALLVLGMVALTGWTHVQDLLNFLNGTGLGLEDDSAALAIGVCALFLVKVLMVKGGRTASHAVENDLTERG